MTRPYKYPVGFVSVIFSDISASGGIYSVYVVSYQAWRSKYLQLYSVAWSKQIWNYLGAASTIYMYLHSVKSQTRAAATATACVFAPQPPFITLRYHLHIFEYALQVPPSAFTDLLKTQHWETAERIVSSTDRTVIASEELCNNDFYCVVVCFSRHWRIDRQAGLYEYWRWYQISRIVS